MTSEPQVRSRRRTRIWLVVGFLLVIVALLVVPPLVSINRYKSRITELVSESLHRPVRLSGVELRALPRPGFVLTDLTVQEDPAYGPEPVLHANTVSVSIRLTSLWRGQLQISRISVDEASLNLVHASSGRWNIDALFQTAAGRQAGGGNPGPLPYMEATNSRINVKNGTEKLPFSLLSADASLWQESNGDWRVRLRGQPARTDVSLDLADTGIVRLDGTLHPAARLEEMPLHVDVDWRQAQLGQLSRLVLGSDEGWRGDLTGEVHLDGTVEFARFKGRLRAAGVHRSEFAPAAPLDFDATCSFGFRSAQRSIENLLCESPIGGGRMRLTGTMPGEQKPAQMALELDHVPAQAGLDLLRTVRTNVAPDLQAAGAISGKISYVTGEPAADPGGRRGGSPKEQQGPLSGLFSVEGLKITGGALSTPLQVAQFNLVPAPWNVGDRPALTATVPVAAGGTTPLTVRGRIEPAQFQMGVHGTASLARLRELVKVAGVPQGGGLDQLSADAAAVDLEAEGPWVVPQPTMSSITTGVQGGVGGSLSGRIALKNAAWKAGFLVRPVELSEATLQFENGETRWDPVAFTYGAVKGTGTLTVPAGCGADEECKPHFDLRFDALDAGEVEAAILGAQGNGNLLSSLMSSFSGSASQWPHMDGSVQADSFVVGPFKLTGFSGDVQIGAAGVEMPAFAGEVLGGQVHGKAAMTPGEKPAYKFEGAFENLNAAQAGQLAGMRWSGGPIGGTGTLEMAGLTAADFMGSATGKLHFDWEHGTVANGGPVPAALARFDAWSGDATIGNGGLTLGENEVVRGASKTTVPGRLSFGPPVKMTFATSGRGHGGGR